MKKTLLFLLFFVTGWAAILAQDFNQFKVLDDSEYQTAAEYLTGNKYQKDAILFLDMVADTHPYYIKAERRVEWFAKKPQLLKQCETFETDEALADALIEILGPLHDKHTDITTEKRLKEVNASANAEKDIDPSAADMEHIMRPHTSFYDYSLFPDKSICYLQFNKCTDAPDYPFNSFLDNMFAKMEEANIHTLVVDVQYNGGGSSRLCDQLFMHLYPLKEMKFFTTYLRFSNLMAVYNSKIAEVKKNWEKDGHKDELYQMPAPKIPADFQQPKIFEGEVVFVMGPKTFSSAGMLLTNARDHHVGTIVGTTSTFSPSHYGEVLPYRLPNTGILGSISSKFFARPDTAFVDDTCLQPDYEINLKDKDASWQLITEKFGKK